MSSAQRFCIENQPPTGNANEIATKAIFPLFLPPMSGDSLLPLQGCLACGRGPPPQLRRAQPLPLLDGRRPALLGRRQARRGACFPFLPPLSGDSLLPLHDCLACRRCPPPHLRRAQPLPLRDGRRPALLGRRQARHRASPGRLRAPPSGLSGARASYVAATPRALPPSATSLPPFASLLMVLTSSALEIHRSLSLPA
jgi:hypothetical protein